MEVNTKDNQGEFFGKFVSCTLLRVRFQQISFLQQNFEV